MVKDEVSRRLALKRGGTRTPAGCGTPKPTRCSPPWADPGKLTAWEVPIPRAESEGFLHSWQLTAHLLGILDEYIPASWAEANALRQAALLFLSEGRPISIEIPTGNRPS